jgi:hypothetical protein
MDGFELKARDRAGPESQGSEEVGAPRGTSCGARMRIKKNPAEAGQLME